MQQEDDLRGLARVMDFMRAISILFVGINVYWFCYSSLKGWGVTFEVIDKILWNFQRTTGLFSSMLWTKLFAVVFLALSCIGTKGVKNEKITWTKIYCCLAVGFVLFYPKVAKCSNVDCTLTIFRNKCDKQLTDKQVVELVTKRKTGLIKGFKGKNGKVFDASLVLDEQFNVAFSFPEKKGKPKK